MLRVDVGSIVIGCYGIVSLCIRIMGRFRAIRVYSIFWVFGRILGKLWEFMIEVLGYFLEYRIWMIKYCYLCCLCCANMMIIFITKI